MNLRMSNRFVLAEIESSGRETADMPGDLLKKGKEAGLIEGCSSAAEEESGSTSGLWLSVLGF